MGTVKFRGICRRTSSSKWTICSGERAVAQGLALPRSYNTRSYLRWSSEKISFMMDQNAEEKILIWQASIPAVSDALFESSRTQRLQNQSVYAEVVCRPSLYYAFLSLCYRRSNNLLQESVSAWLLSRMVFDTQRSAGLPAPKHAGRSEVGGHVTLSV